MSDGENSAAAVGEEQVVESKPGPEEVAEKVEVSYPLKIVYCGNCGLPPEVKLKYLFLKCKLVMA